ncbi:MAG: bacillithiol biosynthesis BshC [Acidobacteria bacterium]|nr:bacillithiol biosynthesis BshC [Acidobacteriota bacterium]
MMRIPFESLPSNSALFLNYVSNWSRLRKFYPQDYAIESVVAFARQRQPLDSSHRDRLCAALSTQQKNWGNDDAALEKLERGAVALIAGQQPGLFTGPNYTILKTVTIIKLAKALEQAGVPAVPVFWIAAEDHDYEEIEWASVLDRDANLRQVRVDLSNPESSPVGLLSLHEDVNDAVSACLAGLPESEFMGQVRGILESSYKPASSPVDAFARMMAQLFHGTGLIIANPLDDELRRLAAPTLAQVVRQNSDIRSAVLARSRALSEAGYHEQVKVDARFTGLFAYRGKSRQPLGPEEVGADAPLSANVLVRPAIQDTLFPTAAYVGGPAEIAYFAQAGAVYETLRRPMPPVFPRISATVLEARAARALKKYGMEFLDVFRGREFMKRKAVASVQGAELFDEVRGRLSAELESLRAPLNAVDPTLAGALDTSRQKVLYQVETLRTKFVNAEARRNEMLERHLETIGNSFFPEKKLQERVINITSFLARYGFGFIGRLEEALSLDSREHQVVDI